MLKLKPLMVTAVIITLLLGGCLFWYFRFGRITNTYSSGSGPVQPVPTIAPLTREELDAATSSTARGAYLLVVKAFIDADKAAMKRICTPKEFKFVGGFPIQDYPAYGNDLINKPVTWLKVSSSVTCAEVQVFSYPAYPNNRVEQYELCFDKTSKGWRMSSTSFSHY